MDKITLDREVFKALASDTRLDILKALDVRQKTVTELAKELELNKATVFEHLEKLAAVGLIQKVEEDVERKWVYWQLTWTGRRLLHPEKITLAVLLSTAGGSIVTAIATMWLWLQSRPTTEPPPENDIMSVRAISEETPQQAAAADPLWLGVAIGFGVLTLILLTAAIVVRRRAQQKKRAQPPTA